MNSQLVDRRVTPMTVILELSSRRQLERQQAEGQGAGGQQGWIGSFRRQQGHHMKLRFQGQCLIEISFVI